MAKFLFDYAKTEKRTRQVDLFAEIAGKVNVDVSADLMIYGVECNCYDYCDCHSFSNCSDEDCEADCGFEHDCCSHSEYVYMDFSDEYDIKTRYYRVYEFMGEEGTLSKEDLRGAEYDYLENIEGISQDFIEMISDLDNTKLNDIFYMADRLECVDNCNSSGYFGICAHNFVKAMLLNDIQLEDAILEIISTQQQ